MKQYFPLLLVGLVEKMSLSRVSPTSLTLVLNEKYFYVCLTFIVYKEDFFIRLAWVFNKKPLAIVLSGLTFVIDFKYFEISLAFILHNKYFYICLTNIFNRKNLLRIRLNNAEGRN